MRAVVLGAAAGGGFPQWNSNAEACRRARAGDPGAKRRTQASLAVSGDGERWFLINASPDLREQIQAQAILHPRRGLRSSPIEGVILTGADVDAIAGLLHHARAPGVHALWQRPGAGRAEGQSDLRRAVRRLRAPRDGAARPGVRAASCRRQRQRARGRAVRRAGQGRALSRDRLVAAGAGRQGGRHGRRRDPRRAASGWSTSRAAPA